MLRGRLKGPDHIYIYIIYVYCDYTIYVYCDYIYICIIYCDYVYNIYI